MSDTASTPPSAEIDEQTRRDFLLVSTATVGAVGTALSLWPFINSLNPAADTLALATTEVNLAPIKEGQSITVVWQGKPVFIRHRTAAEIEQAKKDDAAALPDPAKDADRVKKADWLIMVGVCTHLGCIPLGQKEGEPKGEFGGWFCPCHGSHYDTSGRIRKGPAPQNLHVPSYEFTSDTQVVIG
ncbi:MAG: ubiquinol-cytochrome c reductase iron-sulfur subunit [Rhodospirillales bacterium CG15_BIG_FIL_POST_REV_8_21_14_020_66_15]|nr:MAG: ubiquinol-cytochrome c reductase iron-sulfur subunit [Rhodospirillales bacterium CG15_BIG_FIL_POST_REV_8_21_14_020_66_15]